MSITMQKTHLAYEVKGKAKVRTVNVADCANCINIKVMLLKPSKQRGSKVWNFSFPKFFQNLGLESV